MPESNDRERAQHDFFGPVHRRLLPDAEATSPWHRVQNWQEHTPPPKDSDGPRGVRKADFARFAHDSVRRNPDTLLEVHRHRLGQGCARRSDTPTPATARACTESTRSTPKLAHVRKRRRTVVDPACDSSLDRKEEQGPCLLGSSVEQDKAFGRSSHPGRDES
jgi:hypothetical protein